MSRMEARGPRVVSPLLLRDDLRKLGASYPDSSQSYDKARVVRLRPASGRHAGLQIKFRPQINLPRIRIIDQQFGFAFADHFAVMDQISAIDQLQRFPDVVIGDEDAEAALLEAADDFLHLINRDRIDAAKRLVE